MGSGRCSKQISFGEQGVGERVSVGSPRAPPRVTAINPPDTHAGSSGVSMLGSQEGTWGPLRCW